jgi:hypothetical protein
VNDTAIEIQIYRTSHTEDIFKKIILFEARIKHQVDNICPDRRWRSLIQIGNTGGSFISFRINVSDTASVPVHQGRNIMNVPLDKFSMRSSLRKIWVRFNGIYWDMNVCGINHKTILLAVRH